MALNWQMPFKRLYAGSLDADYSFETKLEMDGFLTSPLKYAGMQAYCKQTNTIYYLNKTMDRWIPLGSSSNTTFTDSIIVTNPVGLLTEGTDLKGLDVIEAIKLMVTDPPKPWADTTILYGVMDDINVDTVSYSDSNFNSLITTNDIYVKTVHTSVNQYIAFICPTSVVPVVIKDLHGFDNTGEFIRKDINLILPSGSTVTYSLYHSRLRIGLTDFSYYWYFEEPN